MTAANGQLRMASASLQEAGPEVDTGVTTPVIAALPPGQRVALGQALADAIFYRDPPLNCPDCEALSRLCGSCAAGHSQARAYLALSRELGISLPGP